MPEEKKRLSWREIDRLKDASGLAKLRRKMEKKEGSSPKEEKKIKERYLRELEKLFNKNNSEKEELLVKLHQAVGKKEFKKLLYMFYEKYGLPEGGRDLILFLESNERELMLKAIEKIREIFPQLTLLERETLLAKLKTIPLSTKDEILAYKVEKLLRDLRT